MICALGCAAPVSAAEVLACPDDSLLAQTDGASGIPAACTVLRGQFLIESLYFQNASAVGGTALAAYPMFRLRAGAASRLELLVDTPSQVAESGLGGVGLYLMSNAGVGANYALVDAPKLALTAGAEIQPPANHYAPNRQLQPKYGLDVTGLYQATPALGLTGFFGVSTSFKSGLAHEFPGASLGAQIRAAYLTDVSVDLGSRFIARQANPQAFVDVSLERQLGECVSLDVGLGTTFNPVADTKSHYLAAGVNLRP